MILQPERALVGLCPECTRVIVITNDYETWPLVECKCGWKGSTHGLALKHLYERGAKV